MQTGHFVGKIFPEALRLSLGSAVRVKLDNTGVVPGPIIFTIAILEGVIDIEYVVNQYEESYRHFITARAFDLVRVCADVCSFAEGQGIVVVLETLVRPDGTSLPVSFGIPSLRNLCTVMRGPSNLPNGKEDFQKVLNLVMADVPLFLVLNDLIQPLYVPHTILTNCGRVLDGLRKLVAPDEEAKKGWAVLRSIVNAGPDYMEWVSKRSTDPRHGSKASVSVGVIDEVLKRTWSVMNRFLEYRKKGNQGLDVDEFPTLSSSNVP